jgi:toxin ParE1/3/4
MSSNRSVDLSPNAEHDLRSIAQYTRESWGSRQEVNYTNAIIEALERIRSYPDIGQIREDIGPNVRSLTVRQHVIIYRVVGQVIDVSRIVHVRMEPGVAEF